MLSNLGLPVSPHRSVEVLLSYDVNVLQSLITGSQQLDDQTRSRFTYSGLVEVNYGLTDHLTVTGLFSHIIQRRRIRGFGGNIEDLSTQGLGDMAFLVKYNFLNTGAASTLSLGLGPKLPTGNSAFTNGGILLPADLQPGTGALDLILWSYFSSAVFEKKGTFSLSTTYRHTGSNDRFGTGQADLGYKFGNEVLANASLGRSFMLAKQLVDVVLTAQYRYVGPDRFGGNIQPSTGGHWANLLPTLNWKLSPRLAVRLSSTIPVYRFLEGAQLTTSYKVNAGIYWRINLTKQGNEK